MPAPAEDSESDDDCCDYADMDEGDPYSSFGESGGIPKGGSGGIFILDRNEYFGGYCILM